MSPVPTDPVPRPDVVVIMTDEERAAPPYESDELTAWRRNTLAGARWFEEHAVNFRRHYTGSLACVPSRPTIFTGQYPDVHGVTQTNGLGKMADDSRMRWLRPGEVPTLGHWFRAGGYDSHYDGKWHITHADLHDGWGERIDTNDDDGNVLTDGVQRYLDADPLDEFGFSGWVGPEPHGGRLADSGLRRDPLIADRVVAWLDDRKWAYVRLEGRAFGDAPLNLEYKLEVWDSPNSAGIIIDALRACKIAKDRGIGGPVYPASAYLMKSPPVQLPDDEGRRRVEAFIAGEE